MGQLTGLEVGGQYRYICPTDYQTLCNIRDGLIEDESGDIWCDDFDFLNEFTPLDTSAPNVIQAGYYANADDVDLVCAMEWFELEGQCSDLDYFASGSYDVVGSSTSDIGGFDQQ